MGLFDRFKKEKAGGKDTPSLPLGADTAGKLLFLRERLEGQELREAGAFSEDASIPPDFRQTELWGGSVKVSMIVHDDVRGRTLHDFVVVFSQKRPEGQAPPEGNQERFFAILSRQYSLTRREVDLIALALEGLENKQIAETLHISLFTVKSHFQNGYAKLGIKSRQELFLVYMKYLISAQFRQEFESQTRKDDILW